jgi:preprotein translocase subunit SecE
MKKPTHYIPARWKTIIALILVLIAIKFNLLFIWGIFCFFWGGENIRSKEAYFVERIERQESPIMYWMIIACWLAMGAIYFYLDGRVFNFFIQ